MPLYSPDKTLAWHLYRLNEAVGSDRHMRQTIAKFFHSLVM